MQLQLKSVRQCFGTVILLLVALTAFGDPQSVAARSEGPMSKKELKWLTKNGAKQADFERLASYYTIQTQRLQKRADEHAEEAEGYASRRVFEPKTGIPGGLLAHCRYFAWYYGEKANQAKVLAKHYEALAKSAGNRNQLQAEKEKQ
jgi:hypothetical protein